MTILTNNEINDLRSKVDIVDIIGEFIPLTQKGRNYFAICPFHDDHSPSMSVSREKQIYTCFVCGASGNVITFLMNYDHMSFMEALNYIAKKAGVSLSKDIVFNEKKDSNEHYYEMYNITTKYYQNNLNTNIGIRAKDYLSKRHINDDIIKEFQIGLAKDDKDSLTKLLLAKGYKEKELIDLGLILNNNFSYYDVFINRIIFPLWDISGKVIGYSGRIYTDSNMAKYVNTKETIIFKKGLNLYNYHRAKEEIRKNKQVIIMEGFMDVIRSYTVGIKNVIALMGTSITVEQANLIKKLSNNVILCFDGDSAGGKATLACGNELLKLDINPKVIRLKDYLDPDEYIIKYGKDSFNLEIENAMSFIDFKLKFMKDGINVKDNDELSKYINNAIIELATVNDEIKRELVINKLSEEFGVSIDILKSKLNKYLKDKVVKPIIKLKDKPINNTTSKYQKAERRLLYYMLKSKEVIRIYEKEVALLPTLEYRILANEIIFYNKKYGSVNLADFITFLNDKKELIKLVGEILKEDLIDEYTMEEIKDYIKVIRQYNVQNEINRLKQLMVKEMNINKKAEHAENIRKLKVEE
jgi:DNA primase